MDNWEDKCTSLKPADDNYAFSRHLIEKTGCKSQNDALTECLNRNRKDWSKCQQQTLSLSQCLQPKKSQQQ